MLAGEDINLEDALRGEDLPKFRRQILAAKNPHATAMFFDTFINAFLHVIVRYGREQRGLFGKCIAYYGTVEAQGRETT